MSKETGGYAFPKGSTFNDGMTLRDYFAAKALQGLLANPEWWNYIGGTDSNKTAKAAYHAADAMLEARK